MFGRHKPVGAEDLLEAIGRNYKDMSDQHNVEKQKRTDTDILYGFLERNSAPTLRLGANQDLCRLKMRAGKKFLELTGAGQALPVAKIINYSLFPFHNNYGDGWMGMLEIFKGIEVMERCVDLLGVSKEFAAQQQQAATFLYVHALQLRDEAAEFIQRASGHMGQSYQKEATRIMEKALQIAPQADQFTIPGRPIIVGPPRSVPSGVEGGPDG